MADNSSFEEHISSTNSRLSSIRASLVDAASFPQACIELTKWCSDQRAFTSHFEENLMLALQVAMENGSKENYDFNLTHALVSACFSHRKHLSRPSATQISRWYEQMRRLKKNGGKRKRAPPKPKEPPTISAPLASTLTSPGPPPPLSNGDNNNFMFSPSSDGSMWTQGGPPGSSGHVPSGAPFPGPMAHPGVYPGSGVPGGPVGQMPLPYGQMEGNHNMYDQRMMANRVAGRPGMMPDYPQMPMGQAPVNPQMMRMPMQCPPHPGHPNQMQYGQMMRAPPVSIYGQMNHPQPFPVTAHPNPVPPIAPEIKAIYDNGYAFLNQRELMQESLVPLGSNGIELQVLPDTFQQVMESTDYDCLLSVWQIAKGNAEFRFFFNEQPVMDSSSEEKTVSLRHLLKSGNNILNIGYNSSGQQFHKFCCEFVARKPIMELRRLCITSRDQQLTVQQNRSLYMQMAQRRQAHVVNVSINCGLSKKRMLTPARHVDCKKIVFDLGVLLNANKNKTHYYCNACSAYFTFKDITVDLFLSHLLQQTPYGVNEIIVDKTGAVRIGDVEKDEPKPKRGKKKNDDSNGTAIKRIKSETFVKQEPGIFPDIHGRGIPFSPMPMPGSVPPDWSRLQSPSYSMHSPNKIQLGPATPATPGIVFQNPASAGSMLNMSSPRQTIMPLPGPHTMMPPREQVPPVASGSAPYTPESIMSEADQFSYVDDTDILPEIAGFYENFKAYKVYLEGSGNDKMEIYDTAPYDDIAVSHRQETAQPIQAPASSSSTNSAFAPPFDDIHLGNRTSN